MAYSFYGRTSLNTEVDFVNYYHFAYIYLYTYYFQYRFNVNYFNAQHHNVTHKIYILFSNKYTHLNKKNYL